MPTHYLDYKEVDIAKGRVLGTSHINKFGYSEDVGASFSTIWDGSNVYTYITTAGTATVTSGTPASDDGGTVLVQGLDSSFNPVEETLTIGGAAGAVLFYRVFRVILLTANTGDVNVDDITVTVDTKSAAIIKAGKGQTLMAVYTVPAGKDAFMLNFHGTAEKNQDYRYDILSRPNGGVFNIKGEFGTFGGSVQHKYEVPLLFTAGTDIEIRAKAGTASSGGGATFEMLLVDT